MQSILRIRISGHPVDSQSETEAVFDEIRDIATDGKRVQSVEGR
jgi:hypothetical protein